MSDARWPPAKNDNSKQGLEWARRAVVAVKKIKKMAKYEEGAKLCRHTGGKNPKLISCSHAICCSIFALFDTNLCRDTIGTQLSQNFEQIDFD